MKRSGARTGPGRGARRRVGGLLVLLALAATGMPDEPKAPAPPNRAAEPAPAIGRIPRTAEFQTRVDAAIDAGVAWLKRAQRPDGSFLDYPTFDGGVTALAYHTMRVCGVKKDDPAARRAWDALRRSWSPKTLQVYSAATFLLAIAEHGDRIPNAPDDRDVRLSSEDRRFAEEVARCLTFSQDTDGRWGYAISVPGAATTGAAGAGPPRTGYYDNSNTQFALLGLKAAARCGVPVAATVWRRSLEHFLATQDRTGPDVARRDPNAPVGGRAPERGATAAAVRDRARGWAYVAESTDPRGRVGGAYAAMTAGGVSSLVICRSELLGHPQMTPKLTAESERAIWDGLAWLGSQWDADPLRGGQFAPFPAAPGQPSVGSGIDLYESYGVERAGVLAGQDWMADLDWYGAGAAPILRTQAKDGAWTGVFQGMVPMIDRDLQKSLAACERSRVTVDTCFALLFLKRGTAPVRRGAVTQAADASDIRFDAAVNLTGRDFEDFLDLVLLRWRRTEDAAAKQRLFDGATSVGSKIVEPLLVRLDSPDEADRAAANALLRHATGEDFGFVPGADRVRREDAVLGWQGWWLSSKATLQYDPASRRLVR